MKHNILSIGTNILPCDDITPDVCSERPVCKEVHLFKHPFQFLYIQPCCVVGYNNNYY